MYIQIHSYVKLHINRLMSTLIGLPELGLPNLDPLSYTTPFMVIDVDELHGEIYDININLIGYKNMSVLKVRTNFVNNVFSLLCAVHVPIFKATLGFLAKGDFLGFNMNFQGIKKISILFRIWESCCQTFHL